MLRGSRQNRCLIGVYQLNSTNFKLGLAVIAAAVFYRPLVIWAGNPWDLSSPEKLFLVATPLLIVAVALYVILVKKGLRPGVIALAIAGVVLLIMDWTPVGPVHPSALLVTIPVIALLVHRYIGQRVVRWVELIAIAIIGVAPILQVVTEHFQEREPYPLVELYPRTPATATGAVEDVVLVIVDGYPSSSIATNWLGHDSSGMVSRLADLGFRTEQIAWSHHTFTRLAIPAMLELQPVTEPGPKGNWGNFRAAYDIVRGDNFVAHALDSASFRYTHIESGWNGGVCGSEVDTCLRAPWLDDAVWTMVRPSLPGQPLASSIRSFIVTNTNSSMRHLESLDVFGDGQHDYVFAHLLLPHAPFVVDSSCQPRPGSQPSFSGIDEVTSEVPDLQAVRDQLACADRLIERIAEAVGPDTAVVISADHGTGLRGQGITSDQMWSDADIAERLGIFLSYRLPSQCTPPEMPTNIAAMRALVMCALDIDLPPFEPVFLLGSNDPDPVDPDRLAEIEGALRDGRLDSGFENPDTGS